MALAMAAGALVVTVLTAGAYVVTHAGNRPLPAGAHSVEIYTVDDDLTTVVPPDQRPGVVGRFIGMCDADSYYMEIDGAGQCLTLNGSLGTVRATGTRDGVELSAADAGRVRDIVRREDASATRVVLSYDGGWAGLVKVADLDAGGPVRGSAIS
jgi:hypothetical protein